MLTIFSIPKAFAGATRIVQDNAIGSWTRLGAGCEIVLLGDDPGVAEAASRHKVRHEPAIVRNEFGTPIIAGVFARMDGLARHPILALVNADIILLSDFLPALDAIVRSRAKFMAVASRFNCGIDQSLSFERGWDTALRERTRTENRMYPAAGSDIFVYTRGLLGAVPPFAIGRGYWDNWLMLRARQRGASLIDATEAVIAVHQDHGYGHVVNTPAASEAKVLASAEGKRNLELAGGRGRLYTVYDATAVLTANHLLRSTLIPWLIWRRAKAWLRRKIAIVSPNILTYLQAWRTKR